MRNTLVFDLKNESETNLCIDGVAENENTIYFLVYADDSGNVPQLTVNIGETTVTATYYIDYGFFYFQIPSTVFPTAESIISFTMTITTNTERTTNPFYFQFSAYSDGELYVTKTDNYIYNVSYKQVLTPEEIADGISEIVNIQQDIYNIDNSISGINSDISDITSDISGITADVESITDEIEALPETISEEVTKAENMEASWCYSRFMIVDFLETNFEAIDVNQPYQAVRNYIQIYENEIKVIEATISNSLTEDYTDPNGQTLYWTSITGTDAYTYFTYSSPLITSADKRPEGATDAQFEEMYKVKVRKATAEYEKATLGFPSNGQTGEPELVMGVGDQNGYGKLYVRKTTTEAQVVYTSQTEQGQERGITIKNDGLYQIRGIEEVKIPVLYIDDTQPLTPEVGDLWFEPITQQGGE